MNDFNEFLAGLTDIIGKLKEAADIIDEQGGLLRGGIDEEEARLDARDAEWREYEACEDLREAFESLERGVDALCAASVHVHEAVSRLESRK